jgi:hypothetical protein
MKTTVLSIVLALITMSVFSQQQKRINYLTIWFEKKYNYTAKHYYHLMIAELGNAGVPEVSSLVVYKSERNLKNNEVYFYSEFNDSAKAYYNYFTNPTAALEYLSKHGWQLVSVAPQMIPDLNYDTGTRRLITLSRPVFYLKKETE